MRTNIRRSIIAALAGIVAVASIGLTPAEARHRHYGNAAVAAGVIGLFGTIAALAAADQYRDDYYGYGGYYPAPYAYYGGGYRYGGYRYGGHWHHHHHH